MDLKLYSFHVYVPPGPRRELVKVKPQCVFLTIFELVFNSDPHDHCTTFASLRKISKPLVLPPIVFT